MTRRKAPGLNPVFDKPRLQMLGGIAYVPTFFTVRERFEDGEPKILEVRRLSDAAIVDGTEFVYAPASWSRGR